MRKLANTLYVTSPEAYLSKEGENVVVSIKGEKDHRLPIHNLESIVCFGYQGASPQLMALCAERGVALSFLSEHGRFLCRVIGPDRGNILLRKKQYRASDDEAASGRLARSFVIGKLVNCRYVLRRFRRDHAERCTEGFLQALEQLEELIGIIKQEENPTVATVRGWEGNGARVYFSAFGELILVDHDVFAFRGRNKRPPLDAVNALLSWTYTLLMHDVQSALETVGLDVQAGFLHRDRPGRSSLALDLMEELRPYLADRFVLTLINDRIVGPGDFYRKENGAVLLEPDSRKKILKRWQERKKDTITHDIFDEKMEIGLLPYAQAMLLARTIRCDLSLYPPYIVK